MDDSPTPPLVFANRVIDQFLEHLFGGEIKADDKDYQSIRTVFRWCGGNWEKLATGDMGQIQLLQTVVTSWGKRA